jgi:hypothetical protein
MDRAARRVPDNPPPPAVTLYYHDRHRAALALRPRWRLGALLPVRGAGPLTKELLPPAGPESAAEQSARDVSVVIAAFQGTAVRQGLCNRPGARPAHLAFVAGALHQQHGLVLVLLTQSAPVQVSSTSRCTSDLLARVRGPVSGLIAALHSGAMPAGALPASARE